MDILTYKNYQVGLTPYKIQDLKYDKSISEILMIKENENPVHGTIILILSTYLPMNVKSKAITSKEAINLLIEFIKNECGNLELQEVEFVIKSGIIGKFGTIYNDISIDTICGKDGWFETYYKEYRKLRPEPTKNEDVRMSGKEMTESEFLEKYPEFKEKIRLRDLLILAKSGKITTKEAKEFYLMKTLTLNDFKDDCEIYSFDYHSLPEDQKEIFTETQYLNYRHCNFIILNAYKTKKQ